MLDVDGTGIDIVVGYSNREAGATSARHLLARGYRRIGYVGHDLGRDTRAAKRLAGFEAALREAGSGLADREVMAAPSSLEAGRDGLERILARTPALDAVYFSNDDMAVGGYFLCLSRGLRPSPPGWRCSATTAWTSPGWRRSRSPRSGRRASGWGRPPPGWPCPANPHRWSTSVSNWSRARPRDPRRGHRRGTAMTESTLREDVCRSAAPFSNAA